MQEKMATATSLLSREDRIAALHQKLTQVTEFLSPYIPLADLNTIDFFIKDLWTNWIPENFAQDIFKLPESQRWTFSSYPVVEKPLIDFDEYEETNVIENDPALAHWTHSTFKDFLTSARNVYFDCIGKEILTSLAEVYKLLNCADFEYEVLSIPHLISPKKCHEVDVMADLCARMATALSTAATVDLGSGKGYLGTKLAFAYQRNVLGVDCSETNTTGAVKRSEKLDKKWSHLVKKYSTNDSKVPENVSMHYQASTDYISAKTDFSELIKDKFPDSDGGDCLLTGLHTCGNLAAHCLRIFTENKNVVDLCNVGCCYEHLTQYGETSAYGCDDATVSGFPMSEFVKQRDFMLVKQVRSLASQPLLRIADENRRPSKSLFWRAVLQQILTDKHGGQSRDTWMVGKAGNKCTDFVSYCRKSLERLKMQEISDSLSDAVLNEYESRYLDREKRIYAFFQLRIVLSPLIEAVILLDRLLYLLESVSRVF